MPCNILLYTMRPSSCPCPTLRSPGALAQTGRPIWPQVDLGWVVSSSPHSNKQFAKELCSVMAAQKTGAGWAMIFLRIWTLSISTSQLQSIGEPSEWQYHHVRRLTNLHMFLPAGLKPYVCFCVFWSSTMMMLYGCCLQTKMMFFGGWWNACYGWGGVGWGRDNDVRCCLQTKMMFFGGWWNVCYGWGGVGQG